MIQSPEFACLVGRVYQEWEAAIDPSKYRFLRSGDRFVVKAERSYRSYRDR